MKNVFIAIALLITLGCKEENPYEFEDLNDLEIFLDKLENEIKNMIGTSCSGNDRCFAIALGSKPCGGPQEYLIYSGSATDVITLEAKVKHYNELQTEFNQRKGVVSDCLFVEEPETGCVDGHCQKIIIQD